MEAMVFLVPSLPSEIKQMFGATIKGYHKDSGKIALDGPIGGIEKAYEHVYSKMRLLLKDEVILDYDNPLEQLEMARSELKSDGIYLSPEPSSKRVVNLYHFCQLDIAEIRQRIKSLLLSVKTVSCKPEEVIFLQHCSDERSIFQQLAKVSFNQEAIVLKGTPPSIESAEKVIKSILSEIHWHKVSLSASAEVEYHIKQSVLEPFQRKDRTFRHFITTRCDTKQTDMYIFSANAEIYAEACRLLDQLSPTTRRYPLPETGGEVVAKMQSELETKYLVRIACSMSSNSVMIHGLITNKLDQCYEELKIKVESTLPSMKLLPITDTQNQLFRQLYQKELNGLRKLCSSLSITKNNHLQVTGTIKEVDDVIVKLNSGLLSLEMCSESFQVRCKPQQHKMWQKWWQHLKEREKERSKVFIMYTSTHTPVDIVFDFEVLGTSRKVKEVRAVIAANEVEVSLVPLPRMALKSLSQAKKVNNLKFLDNLTVCLLDINEWKKEVVLCAPKECADDLKVAIEQIHAIVGYEQTEIVFVHDPVVRLILQSKRLSDPYLAQVKAETDQYDITFSILKEPEVRLQITGVMSSLEIAKPAIRRLTIDAIEKSIDLKLVSLRLIYLPLLTAPDFAPEFGKLKLKLRDEYCVTCFLNENTNQLLSCTSGSYQGSSIQIEVIKGNILLEQVDAIVNAANKDLKHDGGLAYAISNAGGPDIQSECNAYIETNSRIKPGQAVCLGPGCLPLKHIIHAVGPRWKEGKDGEEKVLCSAVLESLKLADTAGLSSIAIPALGTGIFNVPAEVCAQASFKAVDEFASSHPNTPLHQVKFVLLDQNVADEFSPFTKRKDFTLPLEKSDELPVADVSITSPEDVSTPTDVIFAEPTLPTSATLSKGVYVESSISSPSTDTFTPSYGVSAPSSDASVSAIAYFLWEWEDDRQRSVPYTAEVNHQLNSAYLNNPLGSCSISINSTSYTVDFITMKQTNKLSGFTRQVTRRHQSVKAIPGRELPQRYDLPVSWASKLKRDPDETVSAQSSKVTWQYRNDRQMFTSYTPEDSESIEKLYQCSGPGFVRINEKRYRFNFRRMKQINAQTNYMREIRRLCSSVFTPNAVSATMITTNKNTPASKTSTMILRGPRESLPAAEKVLLDKLDSYIVQDTLSLTVTAMTEELKEAISQRAVVNNVNYSFEEIPQDGGMKEVMKLEGSKSKVLEASRYIHEQLLLHEKSAREKDKSEHEKLLSQASKAFFHSVPPEWEEQPEDQRIAVFTVSLGSDEWLHVKQKFDVTMSGHTIKSIKRIQNYPLWEKYSLSKKQLEQKYDGDANEMELFHGSRSNDPESIYGGEDAFDMRHCNGGMWGLANYFAEKASYSARYCHSEHSHTIPTFQRYFHGDTMLSQNQILLAKVLVGVTFPSHSDKTLRMPPTKPGGKERYDSVSGHTGDSDVYMTYDNARAYPAYLITYS